MITPATDADAGRSLEQRLMDIEGILHASIDPRTRDIWIVHDPEHEAGPVELAVRNVLAASAPELAETTIHVALRSFSGPRRRVRFVDAVRHDHENGVTITVRLEWNGVTHEGSATGERGLAVELKTSARAALISLEKLTNHDLGLRIIGVKQVQAFDYTIMVASIVRSEGSPKHLIGAVIVGENPLDTAAIAVLSGLNRTLGNFLYTPD
jgi:hypothetical protein